MKIIFIRGVPGTGKTVVSELIKERLHNAKIIYVDNFKINAMEKDYSFEESKKISYEQTLKKLNLFHKQNKNYIILEELICDKNFLEDLIEFVNKTKSRTYWFRLLRPLNKLLEIESNRKRKIKNTKEDLFKLRQEIESLKIKNEHWIKNDDLGLTVKKILDFII